MKKTIVVVGFGTGISRAVAEKFGSEGFSLALVARSEARLAAGVKTLAGAGIDALAVPADASDPSAIRAALGKARAAIGPLTAIHWNAYGGRDAGDLLTADAPSIRSVFEVSVVALLAAIQEALPDLKASQGAVLVTNGAFGDNLPQIDQSAVAAGAMGLALANAAKHKLVGLLAQRLIPEGVYIGEVMVAGLVKGTAWDSGNATIEASTVANKFWELYQGRREVRARVT